MEQLYQHWAAGTYGGQLGYGKLKGERRALTEEVDRVDRAQCKRWLRKMHSFVLEQLEDPKLCHCTRDRSGCPFVRVADIARVHARWGSVGECVGASKGQVVEGEEQDDGSCDITDNGD